MPADETRKLGSAFCSKEPLNHIVALSKDRLLGSCYNNHIARITL